MLQAIEGGAGVRTGAPTDPTIDAFGLIAQARDPAAGAVDTRALAAVVQEASTRDPQVTSRPTPRSSTSGGRAAQPTPRASSPT